jgi:hypothetical protein
MHLENVDVLGQLQQYLTTSTTIRIIAIFLAVALCSMRHQ